MCGGGGRPPDRTDEMLAVQREQIAEQKRQYEETRADNQARQAEQKRIATAPAAALELPSGGLGIGGAEKRRGYGRRRLRTDLKQGSGLQIP